MSIPPPVPNFPQPPFGTPFWQDPSNKAISVAWTQWLQALASVLGRVSQNKLVFPANYISSSGTVLSTGYGVSVTSRFTGAFLCLGNILTEVDTVDAYVYIRLYRSKIGIPAAGSPPAAGDVQLQILGGPIAAASVALAEPLCYLDDGVNLNTQYWYYLTIDTNAVNGLLVGNGTAVAGLLKVVEAF